MARGFVGHGLAGVLFAEASFCSVSLSDACAAEEEQEGEKARVQHGPEEKINVVRAGADLNIEFVGNHDDARCKQDRRERTPRAGCWPHVAETEDGDPVEL